jgi:hypothetical protein
MLTSNLETSQQLNIEALRQKASVKLVTGSIAQQELMRTGASTNTLDNLINTAININTKLHKL